MSIESSSASSWLCSVMSSASRCSTLLRWAADVGDHTPDSNAARAGGDGGVDVGGLGRRDPGDQFTGGGVDRVEGLARRRVAELAVDEDAGSRRHVGGEIGPMRKRGRFGGGEYQCRLLAVNGRRPVRPA